jgi:uncharacterized protein (DUF305 family)
MSPRSNTLALLTAALAVGCTKTTPAPVTTAAPAPPMQVADQSHLDPAAQARADKGKPPFVDADVKFMQGMIHHHAQAILISKWAPSHGASEAVQKLCDRIVVAQRDEIRMMTNWLRQRGLEAPAADTLGTGHQHMPGMQHMPGLAMPAPVMMPGMLTPEQVAQLDSARDTKFDRLFLTYMIQHHRGAITMVHELFSSNGAANDGVIYRFASDVEADQGAEIERMTRMLDALPGSGSPLTPRRDR